MAATGVGCAVLHVKSVAVGRDIDVAAEIAEHLAASGVPVTRYLAGTDGVFEQVKGNLAATLTAFVAGRHALPTRADAAAVGSTLAAAHAALRGFPGAQAVQGRGEAVVRHLDLLCRRLRLEDLPGAVPGLCRAVVRAALRKADPAFLAFGPPQCVHGDLSPGNVVMDDTGKAWLTDFEDAAFGWRPPAFDLGMAMLRFGLEGATGPDGSTPTQRLAALRDAYGDDRLEPRAVMAAVIDNSLLVLTDLALGPSPPDVGEWAKPMAWRDLLETAQ
jgi:Ser/Thr protein kinase RdoA (MazF antagonist)